MEQPIIRQAPWANQLMSDVARRDSADQSLSRLSWFIEALNEPGHLTKTILKDLPDVRERVQHWVGGPWLTNLAPEVAMFGALSPQISEDSASRLLGRTIAARSDQHEPEILISHVKEIPAWTSASPWDEGYGLAQDTLDELDPRPHSEKTEIETIIRSLGVETVCENLGVSGPRGVAIAGPGYSPTILINCEHLMNTEQSGIRFTLAHELCHILFDREKARPIVHASTPWAERAIEQRANAFAAMLLMPLHRLTLQAESEDL